MCGPRGRTPPSRPGSRQVQTPSHAVHVVVDPARARNEDMG